ncbi:MAG: Gfo/Idh/MocA family protein, partial [Actinomycetes bacterium]
MTALRTALIGYGLGGRVIHRPLLQSVEGVQLTHVVTGDPQRREQAAADVPDAALVDSVDELWQRADEYDAVVVVTSNEAHVPLATAAMELGKAVVVDKPLATTSEEAAGLVAHAQRHRGDRLCAGGRLLCSTRAL